MAASGILRRTVRIYTGIPSAKHAGQRLKLVFQSIDQNEQAPLAERSDVVERRLILMNTENPLRVENTLRGLAKD